MSNDDTIIMPSFYGVKGLKVSYHSDNSATKTSRTITKLTTIGRQVDCHIQFNKSGVSRHHTELYPTPKGWFVRDLDSGNGTLLNGIPIKDVTAILGTNEIQLGHSGPKLWVEPITATHNPIISTEKNDQTLLAQNSAHLNGTSTENRVNEYSRPKVNNSTKEGKTIERQKPEALDSKELHQHYFGDQEDDSMGDRTRLLRKIIRKEHTKQFHSYRKVILVFFILLLVVSSLAVFQHKILQQNQKLAIDIFYNMKTIEIQIARQELDQQKFGYLAQMFDISNKRDQLTKMEKRYQNYLQNINSARLFKQRPSYEVEIIYRIARIFGENELIVPKDFVYEVKKYIALWKKTKRLPRAIERLKRLGIKPILVNALEKQNLPHQFLYLSLQESNFKNNSIGPSTKYGFAKGLWQFIPSTATEYGLKVGPLSASNQYDAEDERFDFKKASDAAARYLKYIYGNEAQASGLIVMASYNWGHNRVRKLIQKMPKNPQDRNFWQLIQKHNIPKETYDYVFYIFSAAVICEDPKYFGFNFENPLMD